MYTSRMLIKKWTLFQCHILMGSTFVTWSGSVAAAWIQVCWMGYLEMAHFCWMPKWSQGFLGSISGCLHEGWYVFIPKADTSLEERRNDFWYLLASCKSRDFAQITSAPWTLVFSSNILQVLSYPKNRWWLPEFSSKSLLKDEMWNRWHL